MGKLALRPSLPLRVDSDASAAGRPTMAASQIGTDVVGRLPLQSIEKLVPQPQADFAFGLRTAKWLPINSSV